MEHKLIDNVLAKEEGVQYSIFKIYQITMFSNSTLKLTCIGNKNSGIYFVIWDFILFLCV